MKVATYLREVSGLEDPDLVSQWRSSWFRAGWNPVVLGPDDAKRSPLFERVQAQRDFFTSHTSNPPDYQMACVERWCAASACCPDEPLFMADWDVINYGFTPEEVERTGPPPTFFSPGHRDEVCPSAVFMLPAHFEIFARWFVECAERGLVWKACHDEDLLMSPRPWPLEAKRAHEAPRLNELDGWRKSGQRPKLVHFSNGSTTIRPRSDAVRRGHPIDW